MNTLHSIFFAVVLLAGTACTSQASLESHQQRFEQCMTRKAGADPGQALDARRKACNAESAPAPLQIPAAPVAAPVH
jgi:hypothetical protein